MENRSNIGMPDAGRCARLAQKPKASRFVAEIFFTNNRSSDNLVGSWIEIESSTEEEDSDAEVLE
jgi:hypothetical protein